MYSMLSNLTKAAVSAAVTPVATAVDLMAMPFDAASDKKAFSRTEKYLKNTSRCVDEALKSVK